MTMENEDWIICEILHTVTDLNDFIEPYNGEWRPIYNLLLLTLIFTAECWNLSVAYDICDAVFTCEYIIYTFLYIHTATNIHRWQHASTVQQ